MVILNLRMTHPRCYNIYFIVYWCLYSRLNIDIHFHYAILLYIKRDDIYIYLYHFTDTTASTSTRVSAKTVSTQNLDPRVVSKTRFK